MNVIDKGFNKMPVSPPPSPMDSPPQNTLERTLEGSVPFFGPFEVHTYSLMPRTPLSSKVIGWQSFRSLISGRTHMVNSRSTIHSLRAVEPSTKPGPAEVLGNNKRHQNQSTPSLKTSREKL